MSRRGQIYRAILVVATTVVVWVAVFSIHGYLHVSRLSGQCCGYEGDPGFLAIFFIIYPGIFYLAGLFVILGLELLILRSLWNPE